MPATELHLKNFNKENILIEANANCVLLNSAKVVQLTFTEISLRKNQSTESESARDLLQKISANSQDVIFHFGFSPKMELKFISDSSKNILGYSPSEIYKEPQILKNNLHQEDKRLLVISQQDYLKQTREQREQKIIVRFKHKRGKYKSLEIAVNPVYNTKKELIGLIGNMRDVTDRIETERLLIETKQKFDFITNNGNDIVTFFTFYPEENICTLVLMLSEF